jgi:hypothetical protein
MPNNTRATAALTALDRLPWRVAALIVIALLLAARLLFISADFPHSSWWIDDAARYTDEGWYASGAINHILFGRWLLPGDFNPGLVLPVWPLALSLLFHLTGISISAARELEAVCSCLVVLLGGWLFARYERGLTWFFLLLLAASPIVFYFGRLAILEEPMLVFVLAAMIAASYLHPRAYARAVLTGLLMVAAFLTKSTAAFLLPAIFYQIWFTYRRDRTAWFSLCAIVMGTFLLAYIADMVFVLHPHVVDYRTFMAQNRPSVGLRSVEKAVRVLFRGFTWVDHLLFPLACVAVVASVTRLRDMWRHPLMGTAVLWILGYSAFMVLHVDAGPRYFVALVVPVLMLSFIFLRSLAARSLQATGVVVAIMMIAFLWNSVYIGMLLAHRQYTLPAAARNIRAVIDQHPEAPRLMLGHGAIEVTLFNRIPAINEFGSEPLGTKLDTYHPGWILIWEDLPQIPRSPEILARYRVVPRGAFPALDQGDRSKLLLYQLEPRTTR